jgi:hypothetical protein
MARTLGTIISDVLVLASSQYYVMMDCRTSQSGCQEDIRKRYRLAPIVITLLTIAWAFGLDLDRHRRGAFLIATNRSNHKQDDR